MREARMLGNFIQQQAENRDMSVSALSSLLDCKEQQIKLLFKGRAVLSFEQIERLAKQFELSVIDLLHGDESHYNETVVHCMNRFQDDNKREHILDIIDEYLDIMDAVGSEQ